MDSVETHINNSQRPTMMVDLDYILMHEYRTAKESGQEMSRKDLQQRAREIHSRQRGLQLYVASAERIRVGVCCMRGKKGHVLGFFLGPHIL